MRTTSNILNQTTLAVGVTRVVTGIPGSYLGMFDCSKAMGANPIHQSSDIGREWKPPGKQET